MNIVRNMTTDDNATIRKIGRDGTPYLWLRCRECWCQTTTADAPGEDGMVRCFGCKAEAMYYAAFEGVGDE